VAGEEEMTAPRVCGKADGGEKKDMGWQIEFVWQRKLQKNLTGHWKTGGGTKAGTSGFRKRH